VEFVVDRAALMYKWHGNHFCYFELLLFTRAQDMLVTTIDRKLLLKEEHIEDVPET
jgi:hypothetical protein